MQILQQRLRAEWQDLHIEYPTWLVTILADELYYTATVITVCVNSFSIGLGLGCLWTVL